VSATGTLEHEEVYGADIDAHATYAGSYLTNSTGSPLQAILAFHSDDAFIALLNGQEVASYEPPPCSAKACGRSYGREGEVAQRFPVTLPAGESFLLTRTHDGYGLSGHRLRLEAAPGELLLPPVLSVSTRSSAGPPAVFLERALSRKRYRLGREEIQVSLHLEAQGNHQVAVREALPEGWSATGLTGGGVLEAREIRWGLDVEKGERVLTYLLVPPVCPVFPSGGRFCGSEYGVDGGKANAVVGDSEFERDFTGIDDLGEWKGEEVGQAGGSAQRVEGETLLFSARGEGVALKEDEFLFVDRPTRGEFGVSARIDCYEEPSGVGKGQVGLMARDTLLAFSAQAFLTLVPKARDQGVGGSLRGLVRRDQGKTMGTFPVDPNQKEVSELPVWLRMRREAGKLTFERSSNGSDYQEVGSREIGTGTSQVNLWDEVLVGVAISGGGSGAMRAHVSMLEAKGGGGATFRRGDVDGSGVVDVSDPVAILGHLFLGSGEPECLEAGDFDDNGILDITDAVNNLNYQFLGGPPPAGPGPFQCGADPTPPDLGCAKRC
jgi:hypothetical protein